MNKKISETRVLFKVRITYKDELLGTRPFCRPSGPPFVRGGENIAPADAAGPRQCFAQRVVPKNPTQLSERCISKTFSALFSTFYIIFIPKGSLCTL